MTRNKNLALAGLLLSLLTGGIWFAGHDMDLVRRTTVHMENFGTVAVAYPFFGEQEQVLVFVDAKKIDSRQLSDRIAHLGARAAIVDAERVLQTVAAGSDRCMTPQQVAAAIAVLRKTIPLSGDKRLVVSGIDSGALLPFLNAETEPGQDCANLSIGFSVALPPFLNLCPPFLTARLDQQRILTASPPLTGSWHSVWIDHPWSKTAIFVRGLAKATTSIAPYDTSVDDVLIDELRKILGLGDGPSIPLPVVEVPAKNANNTVTLFYSGDGGWRDLDRVVAEELAKQGYPVVGVDTLRAFWSSKTPEQATDDLARTLDYYRKTWGAKAFVLAGYSFGADILPSMYNRLSAEDRESIRLMVLLAVSQQADFEIHVSGWIGKDNPALPIAPELARLPKNKILCIYGQEEKSETACADIANTQASILELPGGHHFDEDYPKLTRLIVEKYRAVGINATTPPGGQR